MLVSLPLTTPSFDMKKQSSVVIKLLSFHLFPPKFNNLLNLENNTIAENYVQYSISWYHVAWIFHLRGLYVIYRKVSNMSNTLI